MTRYSCFIIDDEPLAIDVIRHHLANIEGIELKGTFTSALEAFSAIKTSPVDLLFLDIQMPTFTGLDLMKSLKDPPEIIITTAYREYAVEGFEQNALDYLVKPIPLDRFMVAVDKFFEKMKGSAPEGETITIRADRKFIKIKLNNLLYVEGLKDYVKIVLDDTTVLTKQSIGNFAELLPESSFLRIHKSFIVSKAKITAFTSQYVEVGKEELPVGRTFREGFIAEMNTL